MNIQGKHLEVVLEKEIVAHLEANGWLVSHTDTGYDRELALFRDDVFAWLEASQPVEWAKVVRPDDTPAEQEAAKRRLLVDLAKWLDLRPFVDGGTLNVLHRQLKHVPLKGAAVKFRMATFKPASGLNPKTLAEYEAMRVRVVRQVHYSAKNGHKALDLVLFVNGLPVATVELKTDFTQSAAHAVTQYQFDRNPAGEPLFRYGARALVHFVVSNSEVLMTTKLAGEKTRFLPFNRGFEDGAGNPLNPNGSASSYFWEETLQRDNWLHILDTFVKAQVDTEVDPDTGKKTKTEKILFPRYHQWRAVTRLVEAARVEGPGRRYLIQHSAGSGKTNSIAWLANELAALQADNKRVFDTVVVVTDRRVLDKQLGDGVAMFEGTAGVVSVIRGLSGAKRGELAEALAQGKDIVIVTVQTFEALLETIKDAPALQSRTFAVIADEAHSSQTGSTAGALAQVLTQEELKAFADGEGEVDTEAYLQWAMKVAADATNISYFAFTATPKPKTLELFGRVPAGAPEGTLPEPFDLYTMKQAIDEGFILDVLTGYTPYKVAWQLQHPGGDYEDSTQVDESTAVKALVRFVRLHPTNISQKAKIVVDHFKAYVAHLLDGKAKAMVVTGSRVEAVRWKKYLDAYIADAGIAGVQSMVAFSGTVDDPDDVGEGLTERTQNPGLVSNDLAEEFKGPKYNVMIVAEKFQTGFDQPRLVAMYVDRKLGGVQAVQTLSRLNRMYPGKDKTFVIDFVNEAEAIRDAFLPYYRQAELTALTDPNLIYELLSKLDTSGIYTAPEVESAFEAALHGGAMSNSLVDAATKPAVMRFKTRWVTAVEQEHVEEQEVLKLFKQDATSFVKLYDFLSQLRNFEDSDLPKRHYFYKRILPQLSTATYEEPIDLSQVTLVDYRITANDAQAIVLGEEATVGTAFTAVGSGLVHEKHRSELQKIIEELNARFEGEFADGAVEGALTSVLTVMSQDADLSAQAKVNTPQQFADSPALQTAFMKAMLGTREATPAVVNEVLADAGLFTYLSKVMPAMLYEFLNGIGDVA
ncbi:type I restriction endonuclease subunit R [Microbacterium paludicola]|uniref:type I restriction endonuclease subunit R n=1 Tax=Microbacterium paludicola TaxID=300019 RepID=UPI003879E8AD